MVVKRNKVASKRKPRRCQPTEPSNAELLLLEAVVDFHEKHVKALQELTKQTKQILKAKKHQEQLLTAPVGRQIGEHVLAVIHLTRDMTKMAPGLLHQFYEKYRIPASVRRSMIRMEKAAAAIITDAARKAN